MGDREAAPGTPGISVYGGVPALLPEFSWAIADALPVLVWTARPDGHVERYNRWWEEYTGLTQAQSVGQGWAQALHPEDLPHAAEVWTRALATETPCTVDYRVRRASDGAWRWHQGRAHPQRDARGVVIGWVGTCTDIHDRWEAEAALAAHAARAERARHQLEAVIQHMVEAVLVLSANGALEVANPAALALHGFETLAAMQAVMPTLVRRYETWGSDGVAMAPRAWPAARALRGESVVRMEIHIRDRETGRTWVGRFSATPLRDAAGAVQHAVVTIHDITAERAVEHERDRLLTELRQAVAARDEFLSVASHELNTPLTPLRLQLDTLVRQARRREAEGVLPGDSRALERLELAARQVDRLTTRVASLLDVSRITSDMLPLDLEDVDLADVTREVLARFADDLTAARCVVTTDIAETVRGHWDRLRLDQVATNLLSNALKYGAGGPVAVSVTTVEGTTARLRVQDGGMGIAATDQARIFERFERAVPARHYGGLGLGLWITRRIVEALGGTVRVESVPGMGSTFTVDLPGVITPGHGARTAPPG